MPSGSISSVPVIRANSASRATSALDRASRVISIPKIAPTSPLQTLVTSSVKPSRATPHLPEIPRSVSITSMSLRGQPSAAALSARPYWLLVDSVCSRTCAIEDWRRYISAVRSRWLLVILCSPFTAASQRADGHVGQRRHRLGLLASVQVAAHYSGQGRRHIPCPAAAGRAGGEVGIRAVRLAVLAPAAGPAAPARLLGQRPRQHLLHVAEPGRRRAAASQQLAGGQVPEIILVCTYHTRECREQKPLSTTAKRTSQRVELGQAFGRQPAGQRRLAPVGPRLRQRDLTADTARADEHRVRPAALHIQDLEPLPVQRVERMGDDHETRRITGRRGTMPPLSAPPGSWCPRHAISVFPPRAPEAESSSPRTSGSRPCRDCSSGPSRSPRPSSRLRPAPLYSP